MIDGKSELATIRDMRSSERVLTALLRGEPDRVPFCDLRVDPGLARRLLGWDDTPADSYNLESNPYTPEQAREIAAFLDLDNISYVLRAPVYAEKHAGRDGRLFYGDGFIRSRADLDMISLPDPYDDALYEPAAELAAAKGDYSAWFVTRIGLFPAMLSMGIERFCLALHDDMPLVVDILDRYCDWMEIVASRACQLGFDVFVSTDDLAFKSGPYFSPAVFRELVMPRFRRVSECITLPWIIHTDGNYLPLADQLLSLGIAGLHPNEKGAVDIVEVKKGYGDRVCVLGNVDLNLLGLGTPLEVEREVRELIFALAPGGGYILTCGNSLASYLKPENVIALSQAAQRYGAYPLGIA